MSKDQLLHYIDNQLFALTTLREQIEKDEIPTAAWMLSTNMSEFQSEIAAMESQQELNHEHEKDVA